jgi:hypothetical protein
MEEKFNCQLVGKTEFSRQIKKYVHGKERIAIHKRGKILGIWVPSPLPEGIEDMDITFIAKGKI